VGKGRPSCSPALTHDLGTPAPKVDQAALIDAYYQQVSAQAGYLVLPPEAVVNQLAYYMLSLQAAPRALALFQLNVRNYPTSFSMHYSLGDCYQAQGQPAMAMAAYSKALKLNEFPETRQKLTKL
jgi:tetratricopeptide (TPR) repeat protein